MSERSNGVSQRALALMSLFGVVAIVVVVLLANRGSGDDPPVAATTSSVAEISTTGVAPTTTAVVASSTTTAATPPTTEPTTTTTRDPWEEIPVLFFSGPEGQYRSGAGFFAPFSLSLPEGWARARAFPELSDIVEVSPTADACETDQSAPECVGLITVVGAGEGDVASTVAKLTSIEGATATEPVPIQLGGAEGFRFDVTADQPTVTFTLISDGVVFLNAKRLFRTYVVDVAGVPVTVVVDSPRDAPFDDLAQPILDSIVWRDL